MLFHSLQCTSYLCNTELSILRCLYCWDEKHALDSMHFLGFMMSVFICGFGQAMRTVEIKNCRVISWLDIKL